MIVLNQRANVYQAPGKSPGSSKALISPQSPKLMVMHFHNFKAGSSHLLASALPVSWFLTGHWSPSHLFGQYKGASNPFPLSMACGAVQGLARKQEANLRQSPCIAANQEVTLPCSSSTVECLWQPGWHLWTGSSSPWENSNSTGFYQQMTVTKKGYIKMCIRDRSYYKLRSLKSHLDPGTRLHLEGSED